MKYPKYPRWFVESYRRGLVLLLIDAAAISAVFVFRGPVCGYYFVLGCVFVVAIRWAVG